MKRFVLTVCLLAMAAMNACAQSGLMNFLKKAADTAVSSVIVAKLDGAWTYNGVAVAVNSEDLLSSIASSAVTGPIESKIDGYLEKVGVKSGAASLNFAQDGTFTMKAGALNLNGTWTQEDKNVTIKFGKTLTYLTLEGVVEGSGNNISILFEGNKFITFAEKVAEVASKVGVGSLSSTMGAVLSQVKSFKAGFKLSR